MREEGDGQEQAREELQQKVLGAQQAEDGLQADGQRSEGEIDAGDNEETKYNAREESSEVPQTRRPAQRIYQEQHECRGYRQESEAKHRLPQRLGDIHQLRIHGLDEVHRQLAFHHLLCHVLVDVVVVERPDDPTYGYVSENLTEVETFDTGAVGEDGLPDEIVDRHVNEIGDDAGVIAEPVGKRIDEADPRELSVDPHLTHQGEATL